MLRSYRVYIRLGGRPSRMGSGGSRRGVAATDNSRRDCTPRGCKTCTEQRVGWKRAGLRRVGVTGNTHTGVESEAPRPRGAWWVPARPPPAKVGAGPPGVVVVVVG